MKAYCINLASRADRWERVQDELKKLEIPVTRFDAIWNENGHRGCIMSHMKLLSQVKDEGIFMVVEDDIQVLGSWADIEEAISQLPPQWDMLYLGATLIKPQKRYSQNLYILEGGLTTHAIIYNNTWGVVDYILENHNTNTVDDFMAIDVQENYECFITSPMIITQAPGYSDIVERETDYSEIAESYKKYMR